MHKTAGKNQYRSDTSVEMHLTAVPSDLVAYLRRLAKLRRQTVNDLVVLCVEEHLHCLDQDGRLLPFDFD